MSCVCALPLLENYPRSARLSLVADFITKNGKQTNKLIPGEITRLRLKTLYKLILRTNNIYLSNKDNQNLVTKQKKRINPIPQTSSYVCSVKRTKLKNFRHRLKVL